ncbi:Intraflagellar transport protein 57 like protein [Tupaia chinensis]|uniref:Intraflagellar transport protein 57 homolog n=1 Tax=Tupaia chinensis TaxID=246437 RepID=L8Y402_TUPCH|nr:Intraflagellar transport protein 57 like protein [Tupaia chinensis]
MFVVMEDLVEKLKLLRYEEELLRKNNLKPPSRHYFALPTNPGEQFYMFCTLAAWLINKAGHPFEQPQEYDDPNATISNILSELRSFEEETDNEENFIDLNVLKAQTYRLDMNESAKQEDILESTTDAAEWSLEVERVLPQLKVTIRTDNKDWRIHVDQMHQHKSGIESALKETKVTEELEKVKQEMEEKGSSMTDGAPLVKIKQSLTKLKQETIQMDIRIGVVEHTLLQSKLKEKSNMTRDMHATVLPESTIGSY